MNFRHVRMLLLLFTMILWNVLLNAWILERTRQINCFSYETALYSFREHRVSGELLARMQEEAEEKGMSEKELFAVYFAEDGSVTDPGQLAVEALYAKRYQPQAYARICRVGRSGTFSGRDGGLRWECGSELCRQLDAEQELWR